ncbi:MAG: invasion associated locus B family protein [Amylibacter sp.]
MQKIFLNTLIALSLSISTASYSQTTTTTETTEQTTTETEAATEDTAAETSTSEDQTFPVAQDPDSKIGTDIIKEENGDWKIVCTLIAEGKHSNCRMFQILKDETGGAVAELSILALSEAAQAVAGVNFVTPLGTLLTAQVSMRVDAGQAKRYPFSWCTTAGCITRFGLTDAELSNLKKGSKAVMTITAAAAPEKPLALNVSLTGFTATWTALAADKKAEEAKIAE